MPSDVNIAHKATTGRRGPDTALVKSALDAAADRLTEIEASPRVASLTAGTTITNSDVEAVSKTVTIPLADLRAGTRVLVRARSLVAGVNATPTLITGLRLVDAAGQVLCASGAVASIANSVGTAKAEILIHGTPGASTRIYYDGHAQAVTTAPVFTQGTVANQNLSAGLVVCCTLKWSAAHASNQAAATELSYELIQPQAA